MNLSKIDVAILCGGLGKRLRPIVGESPKVIARIKGRPFLDFILDHLVDNYLPVLDAYDEKIDKLEEEIFNRTTKDYFSIIMSFKRDLFHFRRIVAPQRDTVN